jgi:hypothetical protein
LTIRLITVNKRTKHAPGLPEVGHRLPMRGMASILRR